MQTDPRMRPPAAAIAAPRQNQTVLWIIAILLAVMATNLLTRRPDWFGPPPAFGQTPMAGAKGIFAFTGQLDKSSYGLFMLDVDAGNVWVYEYVPATRRLRLAAARSYIYDRYLEDHMNEEPLPDQVRQMLDRQRQAKARISGGLGASPATPPGSTGVSMPDATPPDDDKDKKGGENKDNEKP